MNIGWDNTEDAWDAHQDLDLNPYAASHTAPDTIPDWMTERYSD